MKLKRLFGLTLVVLLIASTNIFAQKDKSKRKSPAMEATAQINGVDVTINYGAPSVNDRKVWGKLVPYNKVWRTGANEATTFEVSKDVMIEGRKLPKGKYGLFTIPQENGTWTIIFNSVADQWGAYDYNDSKDILRVDVKSKSSDMTEMFTIDIDNDGTVQLMWDKAAIPFKVSAE